MSLKTRIFTTHLNPGIKDAEDRVMMVEEGFSWLALLFTFFWLICNRLWLEALGYLVLLGLIQYGVEVYGLSPAVVMVGQLFLAVLLGFSAFDLKRAALERRGYRMSGVVAAESPLNAERRYYDHTA